MAGMRLPLAFAILLACPCGVPAQVRPLPDTLIEGTETYRDFREEMYGRSRIRLHTSWGIYELSRPEFSPAGFTYGSVELVDGEPGEAQLPDPIPFSALTRIDVRKGHAAVGAGGGFVFGFLAGVAFCKSGGFFDPGCEQPGSYGLAFGGLGALIGLVVGESMYGWSPVYEAVPTSPPRDPRSSISVGLRIPLGGI